MTEGRQPQGAELGIYTSSVNDTLNTLTSINLISRIWEKDPTAWAGKHEVIANRLGWLNAANYMSENLLTINDFIKEIQALKFENFVLIGMGGSSVGPYVLSTIDQANKKLIVLDSTVPAFISSVFGRLNLQKTLFIIASKSGDTLETVSLFDYSWEQVKIKCNQTNPYDIGKHFVAITDENSPLAAIGRDRNFLKVFINDTTIGGRYSSTSYFGYVPAALMGVDCHKLHSRIAHMSKRCEPSVGIRNNPGGWLGAALATLYNHGRDKVTIITSKSISPFSAWIEQILAESTGKSSKGLVPIINEPLLEPDDYADDRVFVHMRMQGDDNAADDVAIARVSGLGHPVITIQLEDAYDLGAEFFRWQMATAVIGHILNINPFDEPDVQYAKKTTLEKIENRQSVNDELDCNQVRDFNELAQNFQNGDYLAILAYVEQTNGVNDSLNILRKRIASKKKIATTLNYGPGYLHSAGQLHKGGPDNGIYLLLFSDPILSIPIPHKDYDFGRLLHAQILGDVMALQQKNRKFICLNLGYDSEAGILRLLSQIPDL